MICYTPTRLGLVLFLVAILALAPLVLERPATNPDNVVVPLGGAGAVPHLLRHPPLAAVPAYHSPVLGWLTKLAVLGMMALAIILVTRESLGVWLTSLFALLAGLMSLAHWVRVDRVWPEWLPQHFLDVLNIAIEAPHPFRPLPYGFIRSLEHFTGDWWFSNHATRWFFNFWLLWASCGFARLFLGPARSLLVTLVVVGWYPFSIQYYWGQPTDPMSHALFVLAMACAVQDRPGWLALALGLGVMAKETAGVLVPGYWACQWRKGWRAFLWTAALGLVALAAFAAVRLPLGWRPGNRTINGLDALMIGTNLGIGEPVAFTTVPLYENYLQPFVFVGIFLPFIAWRWRRIDPRLKGLFLTVTPLVVLSSLCFSWLYESRNYMPLLPLLATMALPPGREKKGDGADGRPGD